MDCSCEECSEACDGLRKTGDVIDTCINEKYCNETVPSQFGNFFLNSFNVMIYLIMYMLLFWFKITDLLLRIATYLHSAERSVKVAAGIFFLIVMSAIFIDSIIQKTRTMQTLQKQENDCIVDYNRSKKPYLIKEDNLIEESKDLPIAVNVKNPPDIAPPKESITRIFTLIVTDETNKQIFKTTQKVNLPIDRQSNPITIILPDTTLS